MGSLGALLIGTGLIAVIGYNWDDFSRPVRLLFAFLPLLATQTASLCVLRHSHAVAPWVREASALLQALATGASIALVSQIYNMGGAWPDFLFWWMLLSLPLVWVLHSQAVAVFYLLSTAVWSASRVWQTGSWHDGPFLFPILLLGLLPMWPGLTTPRQAPSAAMRWVLAVSAIMGFGSAGVYACIGSSQQVFQPQATLWIWALTAACLTVLPLSVVGTGEPTSRKPQVVLGALFLFSYGLAATFEAASRNLSQGVNEALDLPWCWSLLAVLALFLAMALKQKRWAVLSIASLALVPLMALPLERIVPWAFTLYLGGIGLALILLDFSGGRGAPRFGALLLSVLIILRMADSQFSLLSKGVAFIIVGMAFLTFNLFMVRRGRDQAVRSV